MQPYSTKLLRKVKRHLNEGGVIAYPTESCYGFGCDPFNYKAINKVIRIKGRSKTKGLIVIAGAQSQLRGLVNVPNLTNQEELAKYWPGFYSLILPVTRQVPTNLIGKHPKIAVRVSKHQLVKQLCNFLNIPLVSTSANKAGHISIKNYRECQRQFGNQVLVLPGLTKFAKKPSTITDWETRKVLR